ncbi:MAG: hypothetical protein E6G11_05925 [Actinobacteria bacterium]|nr:MAG: hypothetical protein E6G28_10315 [Actinomycetota bacterium]TML47441.1 MAG: hypothetical protein E6G20_08315 [Actinomycetota bacterium]TML72167.1 MAG: hypothetical protein E6G11_05925 [Actinomycetota bacterium]
MARPVAFEGKVRVDPDDDRSVLEGLARAIADAAMSAAKIGELAADEETYFDVSSIQIGVRANPGPTSYKVVITPSGGGP